jgi:hypothetical protein
MRAALGGNQKNVNESECKGGARCREKSPCRRKKRALGIKTRNDADGGRIRIAAYEMICDGFWMVE